MWRIACDTVGLYKTNCSLSCFGHLSLNDIITLLEEEDEQNLQSEYDIFLFPPANAHTELIAEDSGDEDNVHISNSPPSLHTIRANTELQQSNVNECDEGAETSEPLRKIIKKYNWRQQDCNEVISAWKPILHVPQERTPLEWFSLFFMHEIFELFATETNKYLTRKNLSADIKI
ncbi:unnamed protein product, partial [Brenthis ino]